MSPQGQNCLMFISLREHLKIHFISQYWTLMQYPIEYTTGVLTHKVLITGLSEHIISILILHRVTKDKRFGWKA